MLHIVFHFLIPLLVAVVFFRTHWLKVWLILSLTMLVDLDHFLASPVYDPLRCSINFHPLHTGWAIGFYLLLLIPRQARVIAIGLLIHMALDWQDCYFKI